MTRIEVEKIMETLYNRKTGQFKWFGWLINDETEICVININTYFKALDELKLSKDVVEYITNIIESLKVEKVDISMRGWFNNFIKEDKKQFILDKLYESEHKHLFVEKNIKEEFFKELKKEDGSLNLYGIILDAKKIKNVKNFDTDKQYKFFNGGYCLDEEQNFDEYFVEEELYDEEDDYVNTVDRCKHIDHKNSIDSFYDDYYGTYDFEKYLSCINCKNNKNCKYKEEIYNKISITKYTNKDVAKIYNKHIESTKNNCFYNEKINDMFYRGNDIKVTQVFKVVQLNDVIYKKNKIDEYAEANND